MFYHGADTPSEIICILHLWFNRASIAGNIMTISIISIERFTCIFYPLRSIRWITTAKMKRVSSNLVTFSTTHNDWQYWHQRLYYEKIKNIQQKMLLPVSIEPGTSVIQVYLDLVCKSKNF